MNIGFDLIQSIDSIRSAEKLNKRLNAQNRKQDVLLEINIGKKPQKFGFLRLAKTQSPISGQ
ncbi:MAG: hypothetical protein J7K72_00515 [Candidatus Aenigmarchaeota archaeon]|nr:hypothetical protein [Candidatus Aenigmarchaeota archaeon]